MGQSYYVSHNNFVNTKIHSTEGVSQIHSSEAHIHYVIESDPRSSYKGPIKLLEINLE